MLAALDLIGIFVFGLSGASLAVRKKLDIVGAVSLALVTSLAGGVFRDLCIGSTPPGAFSNQWHLVVPIAAVVVVVAVPRLLDTIQRPVLLFDAAGLGLFTVVGAQRAGEAGLGIGGSIVLGVVSAVGGGIVRDVLVRDVPQIFTPIVGLYVIPATLGAAAVAFSRDLNVSTETVSVVAAILVFILRLASLRFAWTTPSLDHNVNSNQAP